MDEGMIPQVMPRAASKRSLNDSDDSDERCGEPQQSEPWPRTIFPLAPDTTTG
jgi:hypothetical protein